MATHVTKADLFAQVQTLMADVFEADLSEVTNETQFGDLPKWDSMGHMDLMVALESGFGIEINADSIRDLVTVEAILAQIDGGQDA